MLWVVLMCFILSFYIILHSLEGDKKVQYRAQYDRSRPQGKFCCALIVNFLFSIPKRVILISIYMLIYLFKCIFILSFSSWINYYCFSFKTPVSMSIILNIIFLVNVGKVLFYSSLNIIIFIDNIYVCFYLVLFLLLIFNLFKLCILFCVYRVPNSGYLFKSWKGKFIASLQS